MSEFLIVANSPCVKSDIIFKAKIGKKIIALDGAARALYNLSIKPDVILGDFDSIDLAMRDYYGLTNVDIAYVGKHGVLIVPDLNQNYTDLEKAIRYCDLAGASSITIIGATGGREDHHESLKIALKKYYKSSRRILVHSEYGTMCYVENEVVHFYGSPGEHCGFVLQSLGEVVSEGLQYQCRGHTQSIANRMQVYSAILNVRGAALVFLPIQLR